MTQKVTFGDRKVTPKLTFLTPKVTFLTPKVTFLTPKVGFLGVKEGHSWGHFPVTLGETPKVTLKFRVTFNFLGFGGF